MISTQLLASAAHCRRSMWAKSGSRLWAVAVVAVAAFASFSVEAQNLKIGVVNFGRLLEQAPQAKVVSDKLQDEFASRQRDVVAQQTKLQQQSDTFQKDQAVMGEAERVNLERQIRDGQRELQRAQNELVEDFNIRRNEEVGKLQRDVVQRVQAYAQAEKYDLIVADAVYFSSAVDITDEVLKTLTEGAAR